mmetsp:Transcript_17029/g.42044  ORF Transcript_17029/g.42044 Transcript_17029/m.42044 type:complete len:207 (-) Transcript_17029:328-948(-)
MTRDDTCDSISTIYAAPSYFRGIVPAHPYESCKFASNLPFWVRHTPPRRTSWLPFVAARHAPPSFSSPSRPPAGYAAVSWLPVEISQALRGHAPLSLSQLRCQEHVTLPKQRQLKQSRASPRRRGCGCRGPTLPGATAVSPRLPLAHLCATLARASSALRCPGRRRRFRGMTEAPRRTPRPTLFPPTGVQPLGVARAFRLRRASSF